MPDHKIYILDTNVILHDPTAIHAFKEHKVVIPMTVLEELDTIKDRKQKDVSREARIAINAIDCILAGATPKEIQMGVPKPGGEGTTGLLAIYPDQLMSDTLLTSLPSGSPQQNNDNRIIQVALSIQKQHPECYVCLVTKDINMRLKAKGCGLENVEDYRRDKVLDDIDLLAKGYEIVQGSFWQHIKNVETQHLDGRTVHRIAHNDIPEGLISDLYNGMYIRDEQEFIGWVTAIDDEHIYIRDLTQNHIMDQSIWGLTPRNMEQAMALYSLQQEDIDINILTGPAGSGKTLIALAYGIHAILEQKRFDKLIVARSTPPIAEDIGFLPGTEEEKMAPWLAAFEDNLEVLHGNDEKTPFSSIDYIKEKANIQFKSLNFMRGRSFNNTFIIIDEAQSLTQFQLKSIITRVGKNSKIALLGNLAQIDNFYINPLTSGLTYCVDKFKPFEHAAVMHIDGIERSRLAAFAEENL